MPKRSRWRLWTSICAGVGLTLCLIWFAARWIMLHALTQDKKSATLAIGLAARVAGPEAVTSFLAGQAKNLDPVVRANVAYCLSDAAPTRRKAIQTLAILATDRDNAVRYEAARGLGNAGTPYRESAIAPLVTLLDDPDGAVRQEAARSLGLFGGMARSAVPKLVEVLEENYEAATALAKISPEVLRDQIPRLARVLKSQEAKSSVRVSAAEALASLGADAAPGVPALVDALQDRDNYVRFAVTRALGDVGPAAKAAIPALSDAMKDGNSLVRRNAAIAVWKIDGRADLAVPVLGDYVKDKRNEPFFRAEAIHVLGAMGRNARAAIPSLGEAANDPDASIRQLAVKALEQIQRDAE